jgi:hypothetical protein
MCFSSINLLRLILFIILPLLPSLCYGKKHKTEIFLSPVHGTLMTNVIQEAIDSCAKTGYGIVIFSKGTFLSGSLQLKSNVTLQLQKGAVLQGSENYSDYKNDAFIFGSRLNNVAIKGEGTIDGVNCRNPKGEEGFRGPHAIRLIHCENISFRDFTVINSANWALNFRYCSYASVENVFIRGGHDGLHARFCNNFNVSGCDFRTGDDAFAGNDNQNFVITDCKINTSCNGFRMGCLNLTVKQCFIWGPGEYIHKIQNRNNMLSAFVHFSPKDENPQLKSGNWIIEDIIVKNVDRFYVYNYASGLWQTGQPATSIRFNKINASGILNAFSIKGDADYQFNLKIENSSFSFRNGTRDLPNTFEGAELFSAAFFNACEFNSIVLSNVIFNKPDSGPVLEVKKGNTLHLFDTFFHDELKSPFYSVKDVTDFKTENIQKQVE